MVVETRSCKSNLRDLISLHSARASKSAFRSLRLRSVWHFLEYNIVREMEVTTKAVREHR
jgi:hypothetical protein